MVGERRIPAGQQSMGLGCRSKKRLKGRVKRDSSTMLEDYFTFRGTFDMRNVTERKWGFYRKIRGNLRFKERFLKCYG